MTTITMSITAAPPADETDPTAWTVGYIAGILRSHGVAVASIVADRDIEQAVGMDLGPGVRRALATAAKLAVSIDEHVDEQIAEAAVAAPPGDRVQCEWCDRTFRPRGVLIHQVRCPSRPRFRLDSAAVAARHDARSARAAEAM